MGDIVGIWGLGRQSGGVAWCSYRSWSVMGGDFLSRWVQDTSSRSVGTLSYNWEILIHADRCFWCSSVLPLIAIFHSPHTIDYPVSSRFALQVASGWIVGMISRRCFHHHHHNLEAAWENLSYCLGRRICGRFVMWFVILIMIFVLFVHAPAAAPLTVFLSVIFSQIRSICSWWAPLPSPAWSVACHTEQKSMAAWWFCVRLLVLAWTAFWIIIFSVVRADCGRFGWWCCRRMSGRGLCAGCCGSPQQSIYHFSFL